jgi:hypothetical protein
VGHEVGGYHDRPDWAKLGPSLLISSCLILANFLRPHSSLSYRTPEEFARQWRLASPSCIADMAESRPPQGDPDGLRCAPALTRPALCPQPLPQEGEARKEIRL